MGHICCLMEYVEIFNVRTFVSDINRLPIAGIYLQLEVELFYIFA